MRISGTRTASITGGYVALALAAQGIDQLLARQREVLDGAAGNRP